jgi:exonuclease III
MKIVTWNCGGALRKKFRTLDKFDADIYVIQECENPATSIPDYQEWAHNYLWLGDTKHKGLGIFAGKNINLEKLEWNDGDVKLFLPVRINDSFNLIAVWTKGDNSSSARYIGQLWKYLEFNKSKMIKVPTVLCGDWNSNKIWDNKPRCGNHSEVVRELNNIGMKSLYHTVYNEEQGEEKQSTFYMYRKQDKNYHIDYVFLSGGLVDPKHDSILIGKFEEWIQYSDHVPVEFSLAR